jgi:hypothetical protein
MSEEKKSIAELRKEIIDNELYEFEIYVQDYALYISKQISDVLPLIRAIPRLSSLDQQGKVISIAS